MPNKSKVVDINPALWMITLNVNTPIRGGGRDYNTELKNKSQLYIVYKKYALNIKIQID